MPIINQFNGLQPMLLDLSLAIKKNADWYQRARNAT